MLANAPSAQLAEKFLHVGQHAADALSGGALGATAQAGFQLLCFLVFGFVLGAWGTSSGDLTGDGQTDGADLGALLGGWGDCP